MLFQKRLDRARNLQRRQRGLPELGEENKSVSPNEEELVEIERPSPADEMEKGDMFALMLSGFLTIFLPAALILTALALLVCWMFGLL
jgi:hypothetical protein